MQKPFTSRFTGRWKKLKKGEEIELKIDFNGFAEINSKD